MCCVAYGWNSLLLNWTPCTYLPISVHFLTLLFCSSFYTYVSRGGGTWMAEKAFAPLLRKIVISSRYILTPSLFSVNKDKNEDAFAPHYLVSSATPDMHLKIHTGRVFPDIKKSKKGIFKKIKSSYKERVCKKDRLCTYAKTFFTNNLINSQTFYKTKHGFR